MPKINNKPIREWENGDFVQGFALLTKKEVRHLAEPGFRLGAQLGELAP